jgi:hypothetical protein
LSPTPYTHHVLFLFCECVVIGEDFFGCSLVCLLTFFVCVFSFRCLQCKRQPTTATGCYLDNYHVSYRNRCVD